MNRAKEINRGRNGRSARPAEDILRMASGLGGLLVVSVIAPIGPSAPPAARFAEQSGSTDAEAVAAMAKKLIELFTAQAQPPSGSKPKAS